MFCPDVLAVREVETHPREKWAVSAEGEGLDFVLEVHLKGDWQKDVETNVTRYARLGIPEHFVFDRSRLAARRSRRTSRRGARPAGGRSHSRVLQLDLTVEVERVRFFFGTAPLPEAEELVVQLERIVSDVSARAEQEAARAEALEARLAEVLSELEKLRSR